MTIPLAITIAIIAALPPTLAAVLAWAGSRRNSRQIQEIHVSVNSRLTELLALTAKSSHAAGEKAEKDRPK